MTCYGSGPREDTRCKAGAHMEKRAEATVGRARDSHMRPVHRIRRILEAQHGMRLAQQAFRSSTAEGPRSLP